MSSDQPAASPWKFVVDASAAGERLDRYLVAQLGQFSRAHLRRLIDAGGVTVDGVARKPSFALASGANVCVEPIDLPRESPEPENIPLDVLFENDHFAVVNKPAGMVVHQARGSSRGTLAAALVHRFNALSTTGGAVRPGIVHRLDRDTTGVIVVAKTDAAHANLAAQFKARTVEKEYLAIVVGAPDRDRDVIVKPIGAHPTQRNKMAVRADHATSRDAETFYEVVERFRGHALVAARPKTGRTHQIRLHLAHIGCPVLCDRLYSGRKEVTAAELTPIDGRRTSEAHSESVSQHVLLARQALHARQLTVDDPSTGERLAFTAPLARDMEATLEVLRRSASTRG